MVMLPPGSFTMGVSDEEEERQGVPNRHLPKPFCCARGMSQPQHQVRFSHSFAIGKYPVTRGEFAAFVKETGYKDGNSCWVQHLPKGGDFKEGEMVYDEQPGYNWQNQPGYAQTDRHPVTCINWNDAMAYAAWLTKKTGHTYSLPSEAEWEYAARGGTTTSFFWGDDRDKACEYANETDQSNMDAVRSGLHDRVHQVQCNDGYAFTSPVGSFKPNPFGLYDMLGNVWYWTQDCWHPNYQGAPSDGSPWMTGGDCDAHPMRGGSFGNTPNFMHVGYRFGKEPGYRGHSWGFRVVRRD
jgi:formylglycine-generating enzyme required for sulfatase activity